MNAETLAEWYRLQGRSVIRTQSSYWCSLGPRVYQSIPFFWIIEPDGHELHKLFWKNLAIGLRYSAPADSGWGVESYHVVCDSPDYDIRTLSRQSRQNVKKGLSECTVEPISFARLAAEGWQLHCESMQRQNCRDLLSKKMWESSCYAAAGLPGFEAWGALVRGELASALVLVRVDDWVVFLSQQSLSAHLQCKPNHALIYSLTKQILARCAIKGIFYTLESLDAPAELDEFKFRMGYRKVPVRQRAVFHPLISPLLNTHTAKIFYWLHSLSPSNVLISKTGGLVRLSVESKRSHKASSHPDSVSTCPVNLSSVQEEGFRMRKAVIEDATRIAELHCKAGSLLPGAFFPRLGLDFLTEYYRVLLRESDSLVLCALDRSDQIVGFVSGSFDVYHHFTQLHKARFRLLRSLGLRVVLEPTLLIGLYRRDKTITRDIRANNCMVNLDSPMECRAWDLEQRNQSDDVSRALRTNNYVVNSGCRIEYWAWDPKQRNHAGSVSLLLSFLQEARNRGMAAVRLEVDVANRRAWITQQMLGAKVMAQYRTPDGRERLAMEFRLTEGNCGGALTASCLAVQCVRKAEPYDVPSIVAVHMSSFPNFFLSFLGPRFLTLLYLEVLKEPGNVSLVAPDANGEVRGFAVGVSDQEHLYRRLAHRRWLPFAIASGKAVLDNPLIIPRLCRAFEYPEKASTAACPALLMSIGVAPDAQGKGVGKSLVDRFLQEMASNGIDMVSLVTDRDNNDTSNMFYLRRGFSKSREFQTPEGRWMNEYVIATEAGEQTKG